MNYCLLLKKLRWWKQSNLISNPANVCQGPVVTFTLPFYFASWQACFRLGWTYMAHYLQGPPWHFLILNDWDFDFAATCEISLPSYQFKKQESSMQVNTGFQLFFSAELTIFFSLQFNNHLANLHNMIYECLGPGCSYSYIKPEIILQTWWKSAVQLHVEYCSYIQSTHLSHLL